MNKTVIYSTFFILLSSCTSELPITPDLYGQEQEVPVQFSFSIESEEEALSRAPIESSILKDGESVGIFALKGKVENVTGEEIFIGTGTGNYAWDKAKFQENFFNEQYITSTYVYKGQEYRQLIPETGIPSKYPAGNNAALQFYAYYPYTANENVSYSEFTAANAPKIPVVINENIEETTDYLYTGPITWKAAADDNVQLSFKHALARLNIYIQPAEEAILPPMLAHTLTEISIITQYPQTGWMKLDTGDIEFDKTATNRTFCITGIDKLIMGDDEPCCSFMLLPDPKTINNKVYGELYQLTIKTQDSDGNPRTFSLEWQALKEVQLRKGKTTNLYIIYNYIG